MTCRLQCIVQCAIYIVSASLLMSKVDSYLLIIYYSKNKNMIHLLK